jgi:Immunity protein 50
MVVPGGEAMAVKLDNSDLIVAVFGSWPSFHDAEILSIGLDRSGVAISIRILTWIERGGTFYEVSFRFDDIENLVLQDFNHQNVMWGLVLTETTEERFATGNFENRVKVEIDSVFGATCSFTCRGGSVVSVEETELRSGLSARPSTTKSR